MNYRLLAITLIIATLCGSCKKRQASVKRAPAEPANEEQAEPAKPDSLADIGTETAVLVRIWAVILERVETEEDTARALEELEKLSEQFDYLLERAENVPPLSPAEFKRLDDQVDPLIRQAASGLDSHTQRIFLLPEEIKGKVLPANQKVMEKFRNMSRAIRDSHSKADEATR